MGEPIRDALKERHCGSMAAHGPHKYTVKVTPPPWSSAIDGALGEHQRWCSGTRHFWAEPPTPADTAARDDDGEAR